MGSLLRSRLPQLLGRCNPVTVSLVNTNKNLLVVCVARRYLSSSLKKGATQVVSSEKTPYEIELEKLKKVEPPAQYGYFDDDPYTDKAMFHMMFFTLHSLTLVFGCSMLCFMPYKWGIDKPWNTREAYATIAERRAKGEPLISPDFAPAEVIESMVPPPGDWEREWLTNQPTTRPSSKYWLGQNWKYSF